MDVEPELPCLRWRYCRRVVRRRDRTGQARPIATGAFDAERLNPTVAFGPRDQGLIATRIGGERVIA